MSTRAPRKGTPSASSRRRWRSPFASDPSARTIRCHGTSGSSVADEHGPGEARRAGREVAVGGDAARGHGTHAVEDLAGARAIQVHLLERAESFLDRRLAADELK